MGPQGNTHRIVFVGIVAVILALILALCSFLFGRSPAGTQAGGMQAVQLSAEQKQAALSALEDSSSSVTASEKAAALSQLGTSTATTSGASSAGSGVPSSAADPNDPNAAAKLRVLDSLNAQ